MATVAPIVGATDGTTLNYPHKDSDTLRVGAAIITSSAGTDTTVTNAALVHAKNQAGVNGAASDTLSGAGAISVTTRTTRLTPSGSADALTLADGTFVGQRKSIIGVGSYSSKTSVITPAHAADSIATLTLGAQWSSVELEWNGTAWVLVNKSGTVTVA